MMFVYYLIFIYYDCTVAGGLPNDQELDGILGNVPIKFRNP